MAERYSTGLKKWKLLIFLVIIILSMIASAALMWYCLTYLAPKHKHNSTGLLGLPHLFEVEESINDEDREVLHDTKTVFVPTKIQVPAVSSESGNKRNKREMKFSKNPKSYQQIYNYDVIALRNKSKREQDDIKQNDWYLFENTKEPLELQFDKTTESVTEECSSANPRIGDKIGLRLWDAKMSLEEVRKIQGDAMSKYIDKTVDPCTDFFSYACGNWEKFNPIPPERIGFDTFEQLRERLDAVLRDLLEEQKEEDKVNLEKGDTEPVFLSEKKNTEQDFIDENFEEYHPFDNNDNNIPSSTLLNNGVEEVPCVDKKSQEDKGDKVITIDIKIDEKVKDNNIITDDPIQKAKDFYKSCMNEQILDKRGEKPLLDLLRSLGGWPVIDSNWESKKFDFIGLLGSLRLYNNDILISEWVGPDIKNSDEYVVQLDQTTLGLPTADCFLDPSNLKYVEAYRIYIIHIATLLGASIIQATEDADAIVEFEMRLAMITAPPDFRRNVSEIYTRLTLKELHLLVPQINWYRYMTIILEKPVDMSLPIVVYCVPYLKNLIALLSSTSSRTIANYVLWRFVRHRANNLDRRFDDAKQRFYNVILGREKIPPKWQGCVSQVNSNLGMALGSLFVNGYFDENSKNDTMQMTKDLQESFREILAETEWLDGDTKNLAKSKINAMRLKIGYPDFILDGDALTQRYRDVTIHPELFFENVLSILLHLTRVEQARIGMGVNKDIWNTAPAVVNAYYSRNKNQIMFPAGILQPPFYHRNFPKALNYGGIGVVIGHEITHGFDDKGRLFDQEGNLQRWWKDSSIEQFHQRSQCLIDQYNAYVVPEINEPVDGINTQGENIADNGGIKQAFHAYQHWLQEHPNVDETLPELNMTNKQLFFLNFAQVWCGTVRPEAAKSKLKTAVHAPGRFRVIGTLSNSLDFSDVFKCPLGSPMNPKEKCCIW